MAYFVYILLCQDGSFYTGYTKNVEERARLHANGRGARYTKSHPPKEIAYVEPLNSRSEAMNRERAIKKISHQQKLDLINSQKKTTENQKKKSLIRELSLRKYHVKALAIL
jgi:putative endonuclease